MRTYEEAKAFVGTNEASGHFQFDLLRLEGVVQDSKVLEIGCGCLHAGMHLIRYLKPGNYVGIEPNTWLRETLGLEAQSVILDRKARFLDRGDFDASELGQQFDFIFSHSVLSHCSHNQLFQFLENTAKVLGPEGKIIASIRLAEGNPYGSPGHPQMEDSMFDEWQYPGVSFFRLETVSRAAILYKLVPMVMPHYTRRLVTVCPEEFHDWMLFVHSHA